MARIRTIKPEFWKNELLATISEQACLLAVGLLNYSDDEGYFNAHPALIKAEIFPIRTVSGIDTVLLPELYRIGYIELFKGPENKTYGRIVKFLLHQVINKPYPSKIRALELFPYHYGNDTVAFPPGIGMERNREEERKDLAPSELVVEEKNSTHDEKTKLASSQKCPHKEIIALYHDILPMGTRVMVWNKKRDAHLRQRWSENKKHQNLEFWKDFFTFCAGSRFLTSQVPPREGFRQFVVSLPWLSNPNNFAKVLEGDYHRESP